jgi:UrcA family protein
VTHPPDTRKDDCMKRSLVSSVLILSLLAIRSANADASTPGISVKFADLDLNTAQGASSLYRRIEMAAMQICMPPDPALSATPAFLTARYKACVDKAVFRAAGAVKNPEFSAFVASKREESPLVVASR